MAANIPDSSPQQTLYTFDSKINLCRAGIALAFCNFGLAVLVSRFLVLFTCDPIYHGCSTIMSGYISDF